MATRTSPKNNRRLTRWEFKKPADLQAWAGRFARLLRPGDVIALIGPLGAGKTTFVQGLARELGYSRGANSPTFALANEYKTRKMNVYHMDMYRLTAEELRGFPLEDYWQGGICLIEWGDRVRDRWPAETLALHLSVSGPTRRTLRLSALTSFWKKRLASLLQSE
jgi:tRNA threonylcarbamoyladenosine biosynthesis protein TsaE